jgi:hypothetical protein
MNDDRLPHFLRVVRSLAKVRSSVPLATVITTVVAGVHCGHVDGVICEPPYCGTGAAASSTSATTTTGSTSSTSTSTTSSGEVGLFPMDGGYEGGPVGDMVMPDAGEDGGDGGS